MTAIRPVEDNPHLLMTSYTSAVSAGTVQAETNAQGNNPVVDISFNILLWMP